MVLKKYLKNILSIDVKYVKYIYLNNLLFKLIHIQSLLDTQVAFPLDKAAATSQIWSLFILVVYT